MRIRLKALCSVLVAIMVISSLSCAVFAANPPSESGSVEEDYDIVFYWEYYDSDKRLVIKPTDYNEGYYDDGVYVRLWHLAGEDFWDEVETLEIDLSGRNSFSELYIAGSDCTAEYLNITGANNYHLPSLEINDLPYLEDEDNITFPTGFTCTYVSLYEMPFNIAPAFDDLNAQEIRLDKMYCIEETGVTENITRLTNCHALQEVTLYYGREKIDKFMFKNDDFLETVHIPSSVTTIEYGAFWGCENLATITLPDSVSVIEPQAFRFSGLQTFEIPENVSCIDYGTFYGCDYLESVYIPVGVESIARDAFSYTSSLTDVYYEGSYDQFIDIEVVQDEEDYIPNYTMEYYFGDDVTIHYGASKDPQITITSEPEDFKGLPGGTATFSVAAEGENLKYKWQYYYNGQWNNSSSNTSSYSVGITNGRNGMKVRCIISDANGESVTSKEAVLTVAQPLSITTQPKDYSGIAGSTATFNIAAKGEGIQYKWQYYYNGKWNTAASKTSTYNVTVKNSFNGMKVRCILTDEFGTTVTSNVVTIKVGQPLTIISQPSDFKGVVGTTATFKVTAEGEGIKYKWQYYYNGQWNNSSSNTSSYSVGITNGRNGMKVRCILTDAYGTTVTSQEAVIQAAQPLSITKQPADVKAPAGSTATFSVTAKGEGIKYSWQYYYNGKWNTAAAKTSTYNVTVKNSLNGMKVRCILTDEFGNKLTSQEAVLTVGQTLKITSQPEDYKGLVGTTATFKITATGDGVKYKWQYYYDGKWNNSSNTTDTYSLNITNGRNGMKVRCVLTDAYGTTLISKEAVLSVGQPLTITSQPVDFKGAVGTTATFKVTAKGDGVKYRWQYYSGGKWNNSSNTTNTYSFKITSGRNGMKVRCVLTDDYGTTVISKEAVLTVT